MNIDNSCAPLHQYGDGIGMYQLTYHHVTNANVNLSPSQLNGALTQLLLASDLFSQAHNAPHDGALLLQCEAMDLAHFEKIAGYSQGNYQNFLCGTVPHGCSTDLFFEDYDQVTVRFAA